MLPEQVFNQHKKGIANSFEQQCLSYFIFRRTRFWRLFSGICSLKYLDTFFAGLLCAHANEILERNYALKTIWVDDNYFNARSMDVYITKLRKLLKDDPGIEIINIHGKGYKLITPSGEEAAREEGIQVL